MKENESFESLIPVSRRNVLKAGAVTAVGVGLFAGTAAATNPRQINFCGCTQVCVDRAPHDEFDRDVGGFFQVILAMEDGDGWMFEPVVFGDDDDEKFQDFCFEAVGDYEGYKVIAVRPGNLEEVYGNPGQCARKALAAYLDETGFTVGNDEDGDGVPEWGTYDDISPDTVGNPEVEIVHGQCGQAGRTPNRGRNPGGDDDVENGEE